MDICKRLRQLREARKLSQGDIERRTGLLRSYISRVEGGHTVPNVSTLETWAAALELSLSELFATAPPKVSTVPRHREVNDDLAKKICKDLHIPRPGV